MFLSVKLQEIYVVESRTIFLLGTTFYWIETFFWVEWPLFWVEMSLKMSKLASIMRTDKCWNLLLTSTSGVRSAIFKREEITMRWSSLTSFQAKWVLFLGQCTKMTNRSPFLCKEQSKTQFLTDIWGLFCQRLLRPACVTSLKTGWGNSNVKTSWSH